MHVDNRMIELLELAAAEGFPLPLPFEQALEAEVVSSFYRLIASVWRLALRDAIRRGDQEATHFLNDTLPGWERLVEASAVTVARLEEVERQAVQR